MRLKLPNIIPNGFFAAAAAVPPPPPNRKKGGTLLMQLEDAWATQDNLGVAALSLLGGRLLRDVIEVARPTPAGVEERFGEAGLMVHADFGDDNGTLKISKLKK